MLTIEEVYCQIKEKIDVLVFFDVLNTILNGLL